MSEKTANEIPRDLRALFTKANEAAQRDNFEYAFALYCQVLEKEPGFFECRKALRAAQFKKAGTGSTGFFKKVMSGTGVVAADHEGEDGHRAKIPPRRWPSPSRC